MNIFACIARVPDTATRIRIAAPGLAIDPEGVQYVINPFDEFAVEEAIRTREKCGGTVTVVCVGAGAEVQKDLRACLAKGADKAAQITVTGALDSGGLARVLADWLRAEKPDAIFCGKQAVDDDAGAIGPMLGALLDMPCVTRAVKFVVTGTTFVAHREVEGGAEQTSGAFPAIITAEKGLNEPRRAGLKEIMTAKNKPLVTVAVTAPPIAARMLKLELPPDRAPGRMVGEGRAAVAPLVDLLRTEARVL